MHVELVTVNTEEHAGSLIVIGSMAQNLDWRRFLGVRREPGDRKCS
jgi:hypothetical protein